MMDSEKLPAVGALSRQLQALSGSGWTNVQTPVRQGFEAVEATAHGLADQLAASRSELRRLEARLVGMEDMVSTSTVFAYPQGFISDKKGNMCVRNQSHYSTLNRGSCFRISSTMVTFPPPISGRTRRGTASP